MTIFFILSQFLEAFDYNIADLDTALQIYFPEREFCLVEVVIGKDEWMRRHLKTSGLEVTLSRVKFSAWAEGVALR